MAVTTMQSTTSLLKRLRNDHLEISFLKGNDFHWSHETRTITYQEGVDADAHLLHELAHALLDHHLYDKDIELIAMERDAWHYALDKLSDTYSVKIPDEVVQSAMDSYRDWLHARSICPNCKASGIQTNRNTYHCVICLHDWRVNEARVCALRRYSIQK